MPSNNQLLKQVRIALKAVNNTSENPEHLAVFEAVDCVINQLQLQDSTDFYLNYIEQGKILFAEGSNLADSIGLPKTTVSFRPHLNLETRFEVLEQEITKLHSALIDLTGSFDESRSAEEKAYLEQLCEWEDSLYQYRHKRISIGIPGQQLTRKNIQTYLQNKFPDRKDLVVTSLISLSGGFSKKTILFETEDKLHGKQSLVIRAEQPVNLLQYEGSNVTQEFSMIKLMQKYGLPIAEPLWLEADKSKLGTRFIVSRKAEGKTYGGNFGTDETLSAAQFESMLSTFYKMHSFNIDPEETVAKESHLGEWLGCQSVYKAHQHLIKVFLPRLLELTKAPPSPQMQRALRWLLKNIPENDEPPVIIHVDYSFNNLIFDEKGVTAVLDWESSRIGDPADDIIWTQQALSKFITMPEFLDRYKKATGKEISAYRLAYARVLKGVINAISCFSAITLLTEHDDAHIILSKLGFDYMALVGSKYNQLIADAESCK